MLLGKLQALLHELYALDVSYEVDDFLTTDADLARALDSGGRKVDEKLLIAETDGEAEVALYLERELLERLQLHDPLTCLDAENLADFWSALEGVSHFTYYAWNAQRTLESTSNLQVKQGTAEGLLVKDNVIQGVQNQFGMRFLARAVVLTDRSWA